MRTGAEVEHAIDRMLAARVDAFIAMQDPILLGSSERLARFALEHRIPGSHPYKRFVDAGGLFSYGITAEANIALATEAIARILRGAKPADLPVTQADTFALHISDKAVRQLGITVPRSIRVRATEILQ